MVQQWNLMTTTLAAAIALPKLASAQTSPTCCTGFADPREITQCYGAFMKSGATDGMAEVELGA